MNLTLVNCNLLFWIGNGTDAFFYVGKFGTYVENANSDGFQIAYPENQVGTKLTAFTNETIQIKMPNELKTTEIGWLAVWCPEFYQNFGYVPFFMGSGSSEPTTMSTTTTKNEGNFANMTYSILAIISFLLQILLRLLFPWIFVSVWNYFRIE